MTQFLRQFLVFLVTCFIANAGLADFALRDGDTVVFLGDSITAARQYSKIIENYTLLRFPGRKIRFINAGHGGETAAGCVERLESAVFAQGATVVTVAYGVNDIGWGTKADAEHREMYLKAVGEIVDRCQKHGIRVFICSAAITAEAPDKAEGNFLEKMCDDGMALAKSKGAEAIDVQRQMREVQRRVLASNARQPDATKHTAMHVADGVHLNDLGQMAMAFAILKGLGAPAEVSSATLDAKAASMVKQDGCRITDVAMIDGGLDFTRLDDRLPLNLQPPWMLHGFHMPIGDALNRYLLAVENLPEGRYVVTAGGRKLGEWSTADLQKGINIASASADPWEPGGPWEAQGYTLKTLTDMRDEIDFARRGLTAYLPAHPAQDALRAKADALEKSLVEFQRDVAKPVPVRFSVRKAAPPGA